MPGTHFLPNIAYFPSSLNDSNMLLVSISWMKTSSCHGHVFEVYVIVLFDGKYYFKDFRIMLV